MYFFSVLVLPWMVIAHPHAYHDCPKIFNPQNYMNQLPSLSMPYVNNLKIPYNQAAIKPSPVVTTKVISIVTKFISKSPMCIKVEGHKPPCQPKKGNSKRTPEFVITKEYFVKDRYERQAPREHKMLPITTEEESERLETLRQEIEAYRNVINIGKQRKPNKTQMQELQASEDFRDSSFNSYETPELSEPVRELLIEDRLDRLEDVLPYYTRKRSYQTSTITVTKTRVSGKTTATLTVKNCIPEGIDHCKVRKTTKRSSKVAVDQFTITPPGFIPVANSYHYG